MRSGPFYHGRYISTLRCKEITIANKSNLKKCTIDKRVSRFAFRRWKLHGTMFEKSAASARRCLRRTDKMQTLRTNRMRCTHAPDNYKTAFACVGASERTRNRGIISVIRIRSMMYTRCAATRCYKIQNKIIKCHHFNQQFKLITA